MNIFPDCGKEHPGKVCPMCRTAQVETATAGPAGRCAEGLRDHWRTKLEREQEWLKQLEEESGSEAVRQLIRQSESLIAELRQKLGET